VRCCSNLLKSKFMMSGRGGASLHSTGMHTTKHSCCEVVGLTSFNWQHCCKYATVHQQPEQQQQQQQLVTQARDSWRHIESGIKNTSDAITDYQCCAHPGTSQRQLIAVGSLRTWRSRRSRDRHEFARGERSCIWC
jgi:hypothetical protein